MLYLKRCRCYIERDADAMLREMQRCDIERDADMSAEMAH
jgi:hypothetical protein